MIIGYGKLKCYTNNIIILMLAVLLFSASTASGDCYCQYKVPGLWSKI